MDEGSWNTCAPLPERRASGTAVVTNDRILYIGGKRGQSPTNTLFSYDTILDVWTELPNSFYLYRADAATMVQNGFLYVFANPIMKYDAWNMRWTNLDNPSNDDTVCTTHTTRNGDTIYTVNAHGTLVRVDFLTPNGSDFIVTPIYGTEEPPTEGLTGRYYVYTN